MSMNIDQMHPDMMPFSQKTINYGRAGIAAARNLIQEFSQQHAVKHNASIADSYILPLGDDELSRSQAIEAAAQMRDAQYQMVG